MGSAKEQMIHITHNQPDDSSYDEILNELAYCLMIEQGLTASCQHNRLPKSVHRPGRPLAVYQFTFTHVDRIPELYQPLVVAP